jgi:iron(III) transport system ATP-binding protein
VSAAVAVEDLCVVLAGSRVLDRVTVRVGDGEILGVLGPSGSGKTTLLRVVLGLLSPSAGTVVIDGMLASDGRGVLIAPERRGLGVVFQDLALWPHLSVAGNLAFGLRARAFSRSERRRRVEAMLERVGLAGFGDRRPSELSGGEAPAGRHRARARGGAARRAVRRASRESGPCTQGRASRGLPGAAPGTKDAGRLRRP